MSLYLNLLVVTALSLPGLKHLLMSLLKHVQYWLEIIKLELQLLQFSSFDYLSFSYGSISTTVSSKLDMIGIDIDTIITFPPISTLFAIAVSPVSLQILTANSVKNAIPVIFISKVRNSLFIAVLFESVVKRFIMPSNLSIINTKIIDR